ncbi:hypothetical protein CC80DRAFT_533884 [Byssothecium circinans]|uniref:Clr5 domain-containing protein n=1 Tax=Byssothecium circinans TaxID=147558 RepID=A0A6A5U7Q8_9PLEO|nr:hypothetical protein CC80DRAFT_533884 [Byssothecium circinans]
MDQPPYHWGNMLPSPIIYHAEPDGSPSHQESAQPITNPEASGSPSFQHQVSSGQDAMEVDTERRASEALTAHVPNAPQTATTRRRYRDQDWEQHKDLLYRLYMDDRNSLSDVKKVMQEEHNFSPTQKQYKDKFRSWKWAKHLPGDVAQWMVERSDQRRTQGGKDTIFTFKGQSWSRDQAQNSAQRTRKAIIVDTPSDMDWRTPRDAEDHASPNLRPSLIGIQEQEMDVIEERTISRQTLPLSWNGKTRTNLIQILNMARESHRKRDFDNAEAKFCEALEGHRHLLSPTHEETVKIAYELANFYASQDRMMDANRTLESVSEDFIERWGMSHKKTLQHGIDMVDLLKSWGREEDALALLAHAHDAVALTQDERQTRTRSNGRQQVRAHSPASQLQNVVDDIASSPSSARIDHGISTARTYAANMGSGVEKLLKSIEGVCVRDRKTYAVQSLQARAELLKMYNNENTSREHADAYSGATVLLEAVWDAFSWEKEKIRSLDVIEASLELASGLLKGGSRSAGWLFRRIDEQAAIVFGWNDERTIWTLISIGLVHQNFQGWAAATPWFE